VEINDSLGDRLDGIIDIAAYPRHLTTIKLIPKFSPRFVTAIVRFALSIFPPGVFALALAFAPRRFNLHAKGQY